MADRGDKKIVSKGAEKVSDSGSEKSPIEPSDYAGLQVDTRAQAEQAQAEQAQADANRKDSVDKSASSTMSHHPRYVDEKGFLNGMGDEESLSSAPGYGAPIPKIDPTMKEAIQRQSQQQPPPKERLVCGMRRKKLLILIGAILAIVVVAAVVGGVVGSRNASNAAAETPPPTLSPTVTPTASPDVINAELPPSNVMVASPLSPISFSSNSSSEKLQSYRLFYQSAIGNIKQMKNRDGAASSDWQVATPIFTDAINNTGLSSITYLNGTSPQPSIFYVGADSLIWEKRLYVGTDVWEIGSLTSRQYPVKGNSSYDGEGGWNGFRTAAVYSQNFTAGAGARLFYHNSNSTANWIQELIWFQTNDSWIMGSEIYGADPQSHIAATIESSTFILRLFYTTPSKTVEEQWANITAENYEYQQGVSMDSLVARVSSDISVVSTEDSTFLYYPSVASESANVTIRELALSPQPSSIASGSALVAVPDLLARNTGDTLPSVFAPLAATLSAADGGRTVTVIWADGAVDRRSGYEALRAVSRPVDGTWGSPTYGNAEGMVRLPLGNDNAEPSDK